MWTNRERRICLYCAHWIAKPHPKYQGRHVCALVGTTRISYLKACDLWESVPQTEATRRKLVARA